MRELEPLPRRSVLKAMAGVAGAAGAAALGACQSGSASPSSSTTTAPTAAAAASPGVSQRPYEKAVDTDSPAKAFFASPHLSNVAIYLLQADNWLNAMQKDYAFPEAKVRLVMVNYGPMNFITYNDSIWQNYKAGEWQQVNDPKTKAPAVRNPFAEDVKRLQDRNCVFYT